MPNQEKSHPCPYVFLLLLKHHKPIAALSMVGVPMLAGFISKLLFATSALESPHKMFITLLALAFSTVLNAIYFLRMVITLYRPQ